MIFKKIKNPKIKGVEYRQGDQLGFWNVREYVLWRDNHKCQSKVKCKDLILNVHHIESRQTGGNAPNNLITLCETCHKDYHAGKLKLDLKRGGTYRDMVFMGIMRWKLYGELKEKYKNVSLTYGYITKNTRIKNNLEKNHRTDALCIAGNPLAEKLENYWQIRQVRKKKRSLHEADPRKGTNNERRKWNTKQIVRKSKLWCLWDKVNFGGEIWFVSGFSARNRVVYLKDVSGKSLQTLAGYKDINPLKLSFVNRNNNWTVKKQPNKVSNLSRN